MGFPVLMFDPGKRSGEGKFRLCIALCSNLPSQSLAIAAGLPSKLLAYLCITSATALSGEAGELGGVFLVFVTLIVVPASRLGTGVVGVREVWGWA